MCRQASKISFPDMHMLRLSKSSLFAPETGVSYNLRKLLPLVGVHTPNLLLGFVPLPSAYSVIATPLLMAVNLPEDILALVFDEFANDQVLRWPDAEYDHAKALAPFTLAAVCQRWRYLALSLASIWAYFGFPTDHPALHLHHSRLLALLDRSKDALVDVVVTMGTAYNYRSYDRNLQSGAIF